ncbi:peptidyl-prolyl cis-trans isomerase [Bacillus smithii]|uniref:peptidyl-prolyl cis-trans isomerase n=1 Tax=Bacillus smithii TaxID=1479 RepID=UPI002E225034|nr:peptidyl-prolyl cis-trans isomerase [Bacillus smithii]
MNTIIPFKGKVKYPVTMDAGVWIFDDRRIDLNTYFDQEDQQTEETEEDYTKKVSKYWEREIREGAVSPPTIKTEKKFEKEKLLTGTFGIKLAPFLKNAEPEKDATTLVIETTEGEEAVPLEKAYDLILCFSKNGKPLREDGPVHIYFGDGSNKKNPIKHVRALRVE